MGTNSTSLLKGHAVELRQHGKSYGEIKKLLNIKSKGTLSYWFRNLELSQAAKKLLRENNLVAHQRGLFAFNKRRTNTILAENKKLFAEAAQSIPKISQRELALIGAALYWGEGTTRERRANHSISFTNSDHRMIQVFMRYLREVLLIPEERVFVAIHIHPNISESEARIFWSKATKLPPARFAIYRAISSAGNFKRPKNFLPYGTMNVRVHSRQLFHKMKGYIQGIISQLT